MLVKLLHLIDTKFGVFTSTICIELLRADSADDDWHEFRTFLIVLIAPYSPLKLEIMQIKQIVHLFLRKMA